MCFYGISDILLTGIIRNDTLFDVLWGRNIVIIHTASCFQNKICCLSTKTADKLIHSIIIGGIFFKEEKVRSRIFKMGSDVV